MENITIVQITVFTASLVAFIKGIEYLADKAKKTSQEWLKKGLETIDKKLDDIDKKIDTVDMNSTKNFIIATFEDINKGQKIDEITKQRLYEQYEHYVKLGGNSYIKDEFERLKSDHKL